MGKLSGIVDKLKNVAKIGAYVFAFIKIIEFAVETLESLEAKKDDSKKEVENE